MYTNNVIYSAECNPVNNKQLNDCAIHFYFVFCFNLHSSRILSTARLLNIEYTLSLQLWYGVMRSWRNNDFNSDPTIFIFKQDNFEIATAPFRVVLADHSYSILNRRHCILTCLWLVTEIVRITFAVVFALCTCNGFFRSWQTNFSCNLPFSTGKTLSVTFQLSTEPNNLNCVNFAA